MWGGAGFEYYATIGWSGTAKDARRGHEQVGKGGAGENDSKNLRGPVLIPAGSSSPSNADHMPLRSSQMLVDTVLKKQQQSFPTPCQRALGTQTVAIG